MVPIAIGMNNIIPGPGVGLGGSPEASSTLENNNGESEIAMVTIVSPVHTKVAFLDRDIEERGNVCINRKNITDSGTAKNITLRTIQIEPCTD